MSKIITESSLNKARWVMPDVSLDELEIIVQRHNVPEMVARLLVQRGVEHEDIKSFLNPTLKDNFPDPFSLKGVGDMAENVAIAIEQGKKFAIFADFDVDGATSSAIMYRFLKSLNIEAKIYIPDRLSEGYGPNIEALKTLKDAGADIVFMLDCGTTAFDVVKAGTDLGLKIIIIDHHEAENNLPECWHVINPKRKDDQSNLDMLAAVGVAFMVCVAINNRLRDRAFYTNNKINEPNLKAMLDIVALGTICDMVPLTGVNRLFIRAGFSVPYEQLNLGIRSLMSVAGITPPISTYDCGFVLGPRINAGSRIHEADLGAKLLGGDDAEQCKNISWTLNDCNDKRKAIQKTMEEQAIAMVEEQGMAEASFILLDHEDWHPGLSGLVAGRIKEKYNRPTCVVTYAHNMSGVREGRGSGRSIAGIHIAQSFIDARNAGILEKGGGHAMAGGFTILPEKLEELREFLTSHISKQMQNTDTNVETIIDGVLTTQGVSVDLVDMLQNQIGPFGQAQPEPVFMLKNIRIHRADILGGAHIKVMISDWEGGARIKAMAFRSVDTPLGDALLSAKTKSLNIIGQLKINEWQGRRSAEMHIVDAAFD